MTFKMWIPVLALLLSFSTGCGKKPAPTESTEPVSGGDNKGGTPPVTTTPPKNNSAPSSSTLGGLLSKLPKDKYPKPGADGAIERGEAKDWLSAHIVDKTWLEVELSIEQVEARNPEPGKYDVDVIAADPVVGKAAKLNEGVRLRPVMLGTNRWPVVVYANWTGLDAAMAKNLRDMKGKGWILRGKIVAAEFVDSDVEGELLFTVYLDEVVPERAAPSRPIVREVEMEEDEYYPKRTRIAPEVNGKPHGVAKSYDAKKRLVVVENYVDGVRQGELTSYYPSGKKFNSRKYVDGKTAGVSTIWFENGTVALETSLKDGLPHGKQTIYYASGQKQGEVTFVDGKFDGEMRNYRTDGKLFEVSQWVNGKEAGVKVLLPLSAEQERDFDERGKFSPILKDHWREAGAAPVVPKSPDAAKWITFRAPEGPFEIRIPAKPKMEMTDLDGGVKSFEYRLKQDGVTYFSGCTAKLEAEQRAIVDRLGHAGIHAKAAAERVRKSSGSERTVDEKEIRYRGHPGREFTFETGEGVFARWRLYVIDRRIYQIGIKGKQEVVYAPEAIEYLNSFKLDSTTPRKVGEWVPLFNGKDLTGWYSSVDPNNQTKWVVRDGSIVGSGAGHTSHLFTEDNDYEDYKLRVEARVNAKGNAALALRVPDSELFDEEQPKERVGVAISMTDQSKTGAVFALGIRLGSFRTLEEIKRGAVAKYPGSTNQLHHGAAEWFTLEVQVQKGRVTTTVNGKATADDSFTDPLRGRSPKVPPGFIGLMKLGRGDTTIEFRKIEVMRLETNQK